MAQRPVREFRARSAFAARRALTRVIPPKPAFERLRPTLDKVGLRWDRSELPNLYRIAPKQTARECSPLVDPPMVPAAQARHMRDDDDVIAISLDGGARAYPWWIMDNHHVANDVVGAQPVVISLCEICSSGMAFDPTVNGERLIFKTSHVYLGTTAIRDRQTNSLWSPYYARAITGPLRGYALKLLPAQQMSWGAWRHRHPDTLVLPGSLGSRSGHGSNHTLGSPALSPSMTATVPHWDSRLTHNTLVLGVLHGNEQRAYPLEVLRKAAGVLNDEVSGDPVVILSDPSDRGGGALAFSRVVGGRVLSFVPSIEGARDLESGSAWSPEGLAVDGPLSGRRLDFVDSHVAEWFIWAAHYPDIQLVLETPS